MRFREFLFEYRRDVTAEKMGNRLFDIIKNHPFLYRIGQLLFPNDTSILPVFDGINRMRLNGERPFKIDVYIDGQHYSVNNNNVDTVFESLKPEIIEAALKFIESKDPTANKQYTPWLARTVINNPNQNWEDLNRDNFLGLYHHGKLRRMIRPEHADINQFKTYPEFEDMMWTKYNHYELEKTAPQDRGEAKEIYNDDDVRVVHPVDQTASCYYGRGTRWCTASSRGTNYFDHYNKQGPLYILLPKKPNHQGEKYQIHFPSEQFMDENDQDVGLRYIIQEFPGFFKYLAEKQNPYIQQYIDYAPDEEIIRINNQLADKFLKILDEKVRNQIHQEFEALSNNFQAWLDIHSMDSTYEYYQDIKNNYRRDLKKYYQVETADLLFIEQFLQRLKAYSVEDLKQLFKSGGFAKITRWNDFLSWIVGEAFTAKRGKWDESYQSQFVQKYPIQELAPDTATVRKIATSWFRNLYDWDRNRL